jgi:hypothetical protein
MRDRHSHITLFNDERYQRCNLRPGQSLFRYDHLAGERLVGTLSGTVDDGVLDCGHSAPFGGVDFVRRREPLGTIVEMLTAARGRARGDGIREIRVRCRPGYFGANETAAVFALLNIGASVEACEASLGIETRRHPTPDEYIRSLTSFGRNRLRHGLRAGFAFGPALDREEWASCYDILVETKRRRGVQMKISLDYIMNLRDLFGERIAMHRLTHGEQLAAAALVYRVAPDWDYLAAWGDRVEYREQKVMNVMAYRLACNAIKDRVAVLDLGISSVDGVPDDGLIQFKRSLGAATGLRLNFRLPLSGEGVGLPAAGSPDRTGPAPAGSR